VTTTDPEIAPTAEAESRKPILERGKFPAKLLRNGTTKKPNERERKKRSARTPVLK
jgi:hypothetical protein